MSSLTSPTGVAGGAAGHFPFPAASASAPASAPAHPLTSALLCQFSLVKRAQLPGPVNSLDFTARGDHVLAGTDEPDEGVYLYHVATGAAKKNVFCKRSGCDLVRFTHHTNAVLVASKNRGWEDSIRYLSLHDNKYLRYFKGHRDRVCSLSMAPRDDSFLSAAADRTVRVWDLRTNVCQGLLHVPMPSPSPYHSLGSNPSAHKHLPAGGKILVAHDPEGVVFAVATSPNIIKLYDTRSFESGPFATFSVPLPTASGLPPAYFSFSSLKFSPDGSSLLVSTTESCEWHSAQGAQAGYTHQVLLIDSFEGELKHRFTGHEFNPIDAAGNNGAAGAAAASAAATAQSFGSLPFEASFSPDGAFVFAGSRSGSVHCWRADTGEAIAIYQGMGNTSPITAVQFCPTKLTLIAADAAGQMQFWMPPKL